MWPLLKDHSETRSFCVSLDESAAVGKGNDVLVGRANWVARVSGAILVLVAANVVDNNNNKDRIELVIAVIDK